MRQTVGVLYSSLETNFAAWSTTEDTKPLTTVGPEYETNLDPVRVNRKRLKQMFSAGVGELEPVLRSILTPSTLSDLQKVANLTKKLAAILQSFGSGPSTSSLLPIINR